MVEILTIFWGADFVSRFKRGTLKSLAFKKNREALKGQIWNVFTEEEFFEDLSNEIAKLLPETELRLRDLSVVRDRTDYLHSALIWQIKQCLKNESQMLLAPPDTVFGDGTIPNLIKLGKEKDSVVVVPHPRVLPEILDQKFTSNEEMVTAAFNTLHRSWSESEESPSAKWHNGYIGGTSWEVIDKNLYKVKHLLPTAYFCNFTDEDLDYFETCTGIGNYDHKWPGHILVPRGRQVYVASSDACFIVEITDHDKNLPPVVQGPKPSGFWQNNPHNHVNKQIAAFFRGA